MTVLDRIRHRLLRNTIKMRCNRGSQASVRVNRI